MIFDIFSSFDPWTNITGNVTVMISITTLIFTLVVITYWLPLNTLTLSTSDISYNCNQSHSGSLHLKGLPSILFVLASYILFLNWAGLIPYAPSSTSHLIITLSLALPCWLSNILSSATNNTTSFAASYLPSGAPSWLNPFLLIIEVVSNLVRPLTLSFRLAANISTGHVIIIIIGAYLSYFFTNFSLIPLITTSILNAGYCLFEIAIGALQSYIFVLLITLYTNEHTT